MSARILAVDTTTEFGSLALYGGGAEEEVLLHSPDGFGHVLFGHIRRLLDGQGMDLGDIDCFAAAAGPGSFTGVRVGLAAIKGLAMATGRPAAAVSNLQAVAFFGEAPLRAALLDARRGEVYGAVYDASLNCVGEEMVATFPAWLATLPGGEMEFVSPDFTPFGQALAGSRFANTPVRQARRALAGTVARIVSRRLAAGLGAPVESVDANYVRRSDAELFWKET